MFLEYYLYYLYYSYLGFPFVIRVAILAITIFTPIYLFAVFKLLQLRTNFYQKRRLQKKHGNNYLEKARNIIVSERMYNIDEISEELNCKVNNLKDKEKRILTNNILKIHDSERYVNLKNYRMVIEFFDLRNFWERKLKYGSLALRQKALRKLDDLDIEIPGSIITSLTYNRNQYLRKRARSSYMYFSKHSPFKFLDEDFDKTFNNWDKIEIHRMLQRRSHEGLPNLTQWIKNSDNLAFKCFLIDEIKHFKQTDCCPFILQLLDTSTDINFWKHCIDALGELKHQEAEEYLIKDYAIQPQYIQDCIVNAVGNLNSGKALDFLRSAYHSAHNDESKLLIANTIFEYGESGKKLFSTLKKEEEGFNRLIFEHVSNPLIKQVSY
ncbi:HEAT repeat domain-containing protein [Dysgonomonas sp. 216]|uniref:HEAT repeat domain-containing protein n=1 Tax=Dysgonomonas sp. 216 TaxID=2302934 RepID=UPI001C87010C|nr:HEAT repeat domain-containing protein [Dysgonomonas sp. 216]NDW18488.1 HEAT repeat domain-containing protein [Dysgonomonas sp. 216]